MEILENRAEWEQTFQASWLAHFKQAGEIEWDVYENDLGDYSIRLIPSDVDPSKLTYAHTHYDHTAVNMDYQVLIPLGHLRDKVDAGEIGALTENFVSFMGYQPDISQLLDETIPLIIEAAKSEQADAVLLVPS